MWYANVLSLDARAVCPDVIKPTTAFHTLRLSVEPWINEFNASYRVRSTQPKRPKYLPSDSHGVYVTNWFKIFQGQNKVQRVAFSLDQKSLINNNKAISRNTPTAYSSRFGINSAHAKQFKIPDRTYSRFVSCWRCPGVCECYISKLHVWILLRTMLVSIARFLYFLIILKLVIVAVIS